MRTTWKPLNNETKPLIFLLALTFLFLFSGNSFGGVFDKKDESVVIYRHQIENAILLQSAQITEGKIRKGSRVRYCVIGDKKF